MKTPSIAAGLRRSTKWDDIDLEPSLGGRDPEEHAYEQGRRNLPPSGAAVPDSMERMLTDHYVNQHQSLSLRAMDHVRQLHRDAAELLAERGMPLGGRVGILDVRVHVLQDLLGGFVALGCDASQLFLEFL